jgi:serine phosphatase RsbU (regulator of sigma subunit)
MRRLLYILILSPSITYGQFNIDSLFEVWNNSSVTTEERFRAMDQIAWTFTGSNQDSAQFYAHLLLQQAEKNNDINYKARALNILASSHFIEADYEKSLDYFEQGIPLFRELKNNLGESVMLLNMGNVYRDQGNYAKSIDSYMKSLVIMEKEGYEPGIGNCLSSIGVLYKIQKDYTKAVEYYNKGLTIFKALNDKNNGSITLNELAHLSLMQGNTSESMKYANEALKIAEETNNLYTMSLAYGSIGSVNGKSGEYEIAINYYSKSLEICRQRSDQLGIANDLSRIGEAYKFLGAHEKAISFSSQALDVAQKAGILEQIKKAAKILSESYKALGQQKLALEMFELQIKMRDSVQREENQKEIIRQEYKYTYNKQHLSDSLGFAKEQEVEQLAHDAELEKEAQQRYALYGGLGFLLLLGGVAFRGYQRKRKDNILITEQKAEVELQKELVEEKNTEILDSITYAKRIQEAILPPTRLVKEWLPNSFILYKPKDIVAGDFYWMESIDNTIIFAAADCTGHGVPGAMVSVVCHNAMNRAVREFGLMEPGQILDKTRELVVRTFEKSEEEVKDGMDIALCSLQGTTLKYAGANNPLWIVRKEKVKSEGESENNLPSLSLQAEGEAFTFTITETKATKQPIGKVDNPQPFQTHTFELQPNDIFYIFSDGYVDQFGGQKGKKFKAKAFRELLLSIQDLNMEEQRMLINEAFEQWRGDLEQVDDVCIIGVKV